MAAKGINDNPIVAGESLRADNLVVRLIANGAITKGTFVELVTDGHVKAATATVGGPIGIALESAAQANDEIVVLIEGIGSVTCDSTGCNLGDFLMPNASGNADVATLGTNTIVGLAVSDGPANGTVSVLLRMITATGGA